MNNNELKNMMNAEIKERMQNANWSNRIASNVLRSRKKTRQKLFYITSSSFMAAAVFFVFLFNFILPESSEINIYDHFITSQIEGTYYKVFNSHITLVSLDINSNNKLKDNFLDANEIDEMIDETLSMR